MQPRMTFLLCLKRSLALRSSIFNSERLWQQRFFSSTLEVLPDPLLRVEIGGVEKGSCSSLSREAAPLARRSFIAPPRCIGDPSQIMSSLPGTCRMRCLKKRTTSWLLIEGAFALHHG